MNEAGWLAAEDPVPMLAVLGGAASPRKLRLFACACSLLLPGPTAGLRRAVGAALAFADGGLDGPGMEAARWEQPPGPWTVCDPDAGRAACHVVRDGFLAGRQAEMAALLRDVFGNPFRPVGCCPCGECHGTGGTPVPEPPGTRVMIPRTARCRVCDGTGSLDLSWAYGRFRGPVVLSVARRAYDERDFAALPVLADALEEAGCEDGPLLWHLRGQYEPAPEGRHPPAGPHARGCWALDLVLGKG